MSAGGAPGRSRGGAAGAFAAVDLGASSGRVMLGTIGDGLPLTLTEVHRFPNVPVRLPSGLHWDIQRIYRDVVDGLARAGGVRSIGVDSWAVDYALLDAAGAMLGNPYHYRDSRIRNTAGQVHELVTADELYRVTGLQFLPFNTIYQLLSAEPGLQHATRLLMIPDLIAYWLTGRSGAERTNASTTGLYDIARDQWAWDVIERVGLPAGIFRELRDPGEIIGSLRREVSEELRLPPSTVLTAVGSHDTASAVVAVPATDRSFAYISCGTWSLVGVELDQPILTEASRLAGFTNERGVAGTIRYLRNVMGLWLLNESLASWERAGQPVELGAVLKAAADLPPGGLIFDPDDLSLLEPGDIPERISRLCRRSGVAVPADPPQLVRSILDSLADAYARAVRTAESLTGQVVDVVHLVGGGAKNTLLCQLTADACGLPVVAGPVEASAIGNILVQAAAHGSVEADPWTLRTVVRDSFPTTRYEPR